MKPKKKICSIIKDLTDRLEALEEEYDCDIDDEDDDEGIFD